MTDPARYPVGAAVTLEALSRDPYPIFAALRAEEPISWIPALGMWYVVDYADVDAILRDDAHFTTASDHSTIFDTFGAHMLTVEGALHDRYKAAARKPFMPKVIRETLEARISALTDRLIDGFVKDGAVDLRPAFAARLPVQVMLALFGLVPEAEPQLRRWYDSFEAALANFTWDDGIRSRARENVSAFHALLQTHLDELRAAPDDGLLSAMMDDGLSDAEIRRNASIIFFGGISTVEALILNSIHALLLHPDLLARVRADRGLIPHVLEEVMRWSSPVQSATRHVTREVTYKGLVLPPGATVNCMLGAANRDPAVFADPDRFDIDRPNLRRHLGFATGPHHCLGSHLAKAEARIALDRLLTRLPNLRGDAQRPAVPAGYEFRQPRALHLLWG